MQEQIQAAHLAAIAQGGMACGLPAGMLLDGSQGQERTEGRQLVRRAYRVVSALGRLTVTRRPRWAVKAIAVAVIIPGFVDELLLIPAIVAYVVIRNRAEFAATARSAWKEQAA